MKAFDQYIYLMPQRDGQGTVTAWNWIYNGGFGGTSNFPPVIAEKGSGHNDIYFTIIDPQNQIKFAGYDNSDPTKAIWISEKSGSPPQKQAGISKDFGTPAFGQGGAQLSVGDPNAKKQDYLYQLNFVDTANPTKPVISIDPEIRNGDSSPPSSQAVYYALGAALLTALLTVVFVRAALGWRKV